VLQEAGEKDFGTIVLGMFSGYASGGFCLIVQLSCVSNQKTYGLAGGVSNGQLWLAILTATSSFISLRSSFRRLMIM